MAPLHCKETDALKELGNYFIFSSGYGINFFPNGTQLTQIEFKFFGYTTKECCHFYTFCYILFASPEVVALQKGVFI